MFRKTIAGAILAGSAISAAEAATITLDGISQAWIDPAGLANGNSPTSNYASWAAANAAAMTGAIAPKPNIPARSASSWIMARKAPSSARAA